MASFLTRRLLRAALSLIGVVSLAFFILRLSGSPAALLLGAEATPDAIATLNHALGFDQSVPVQYVRFLQAAGHGDFGVSITYATAAMPLVLAHLPATLTLASSAFLFGLLAAYLLALAAELWGGSGVRDALLWTGAIVQAVPTFLLGVILILVFAIDLAVLPALGSAGPASLVLPTLTLGSFEAALYVRLFMLGFAEQRTQDFVRAARAKGISPAAVLLRHVVPNAMLPILTVAGVNLSQLVGGTVVVETVFDWPGAGHLLYSAVSSRDYPVVQSAVVLMASIVILINFVADVLSAAVDPRVRVG